MVGRRNYIRASTRDVIKKLQIELGDNDTDELIHLIHYYIKDKKMSIKDVHNALSNKLRNKEKGVYYVIQDKNKFRSWENAELYITDTYELEHWLDIKIVKEWE